MGLSPTAVADVLFRNAQSPDPDSQEMAELSGFEVAQLRDGLALQLLVLGRWIESGERLGGYKASLTSREQRDTLGPGFRPFGYILESRIIASGRSLDLASIRGGKLEQEICLVLGKRLNGPQVTTEEARDAVVAVAPAFEITESRIRKDAPTSIRMGNGFSNWGIVVGPDREPDLDLHSVTVELYRDEELVDSGGAGADILDDPYLSLARVATELNHQGLALEPGQRVITGSLLDSPKLEKGSFTAAFSGLGDVSITFE